MQFLIYIGELVCAYILCCSLLLVFYQVIASCHFTAFNAIDPNVDYKW